MDQSWKDTSLSFEERTKILVDQMTLEEKVSQMTYYSSALSRFGIPEYNWWNECLHGVARAGVATMFPQPIGMAASFDAKRLGEIASIIGDEARIKHRAADEMDDHGIYKGLTMWTPNINLFRDPRWGRGHETYGEDPCLTARMGVSFIRGLQGDDPRYDKCVATAKHFAVHSGPEAERHTFDVHPSKRDMAETYLPAFRAAVQEGHVHSVMGAYNRVNGKAACASDELLQKTLREEWGFDGYVVSDCGAIEDVYENHKLVATAEEAAALAVNNGCDLCCGRVFPHLLKAVEQGLISEETITRSAYRLMYARMRLGMFDAPDMLPWSKLDYLKNDCAEHHAKSLEMAEESVVLLKNDGILPLKAEKLRTVAVVGPNADSRDALKGNYAGTPSESYTILEGLRLRHPEIRWIFAEGSALFGGSAEEGWGESADFRIAEALTAASIADLTIVVTGLDGDCEGEEGYGSGDRTTMNLPEPQRNLLDALAALNKPMVLLNMTGSATLFPHADHFRAIAQVWYPGQMGGIAVAKLLFGEVSPCGKLPVTFYADMAQLPDFRDYSMRERTYRFMTGKPAYPFGYGLSYASFRYDDLTVSADGDGLIASFTVANTGSMTAKEISQVYVHLEHPAHPAPLRQLAAFDVTELAPGENRRLSLRIAPEWLCVYDDDGNAHRHVGRVTVYAGGSQPDERSFELTGVRPLSAEAALN